ncbi:hypothetical protein AAVH_07235 [Aphelenchoides avenae]|nr:hypothetical protein AAVH_07235 [Aphelenchus avenae]
MYRRLDDSHDAAPSPGSKGYRCLAGRLHVRTVVLLIALLGNVGPLAAIFYYGALTYLHVIAFVVHLSAIAAYFCRKPWLYLPITLEYAALSLFFAVCSCLCVVIYLTSHIPQMQIVVEFVLEALIIAGKMHRRLPIKDIQLYSSIFSVVFAATSLMSYGLMRQIVKAYASQRSDVDAQRLRLPEFTNHNGST